MKKLMQTMANAIVLPAVLAISALAGNAQKVDRPADVNARALGYVTVNILDDDVEENGDLGVGIKEIDVIDEIGPINNIDQPIISLDYVRVGNALDLVDVIFDGEEIQAIDVFDIADTINY